MSEKSSAASPTVSHDEYVKESEITKVEGDSFGILIKPGPNGNAGSSSSEEEDKPYAEHGPGIDHKIPQDGVIQAEPELWWSRTRHALREPLSEFFGVFILILFGDG